MSAFVASVESGEEAVNTKPVDIDGSEARDGNDGVVDEAVWTSPLNGFVVADSAVDDTAVQSRLMHRSLHRFWEVVEGTFVVWNVLETKKLCACLGMVANRKPEA